MEKSKRNRMLVMLALFVSIFFLTGSYALAVEKPPIKVGVLLPYTGPFSVIAKGINDGMKLYFDEIGQKAGGRAIQLFQEDDEANPTVGLTKVRRLVEERKVNFLVGPISSAVALAIHDYLRKQKVIQINPCAYTRELTSPAKASENIFRVVPTTDQGNYPLGKWVIKNTPFRNLVVIGSDFSGGRHSVEAFTAALEESGGKVIKEVYPKLNTMDFAPFLTAMDVKGADAAFAWFAGADAVKFVQQYEEMGLKKRIPLFGYQTLVDETSLPSQKEAALGIIFGGHYNINLDNPKNRAFVKSYSAKYGETPSLYSELGYVPGNLIGAAAEALKGEVEDISRVAKEIRRVAPQIGSPNGPLAFDQYNQRIVTIYVMRVEKRDGKFVGVVVDNVGKVPQEEVWKWWNK